MITRLGILQNLAGEIEKEFVRNPPQSYSIWNSSIFHGWDDSHGVTRAFARASYRQVCGSAEMAGTA